VQGQARAGKTRYRTRYRPVEPDTDHNIKSSQVQGMGEYIYFQIIETNNIRTV
jgi:hypothetical protein